MSRRRGTVLIVVSGLCALLAALALSFLTRMRADAEEMRVVLRESQARLMLAAACGYVQEAARLGYDTSGRASRSTPADVHEEAYGWIDVRDGSIGPNTRAWSSGTGADVVVPLYVAGATEPDGFGASRPRWPAIGGVARCPMHLLERTPYATTLQAVLNPISMEAGDPAFGLPLLRRPDPMPFEDVQTAAAYARHAAGDRRVRAHTAGRSWFRVHRDGPATFVVTCGAGASRGFRTWREVGDAGEAAVFANDATLWRALVDDETRMWFRIEWSAAVMGLDFNHYWTNQSGHHESYLTYPMNTSHNRNHISWCEIFQGSQSNAKNPVGTIRWVQRLRDEPSIW